MSAPFNRVIVLDLETSWGRAVQLGFSCQTMEEYIRDKRFKAWGLSWKELGGDAPAVWVTRKDLPVFFKSIDWSTTAVMAQNAAFDVSIMEWHYNAHPAFIMDTLSMGRALRGVEVGNSLAKLAKDLGLPPKGDGLSPSENILDELPEHVERVLADYCCHDTWLCEQIFFGLGGWDYPRSELRLIDMTIKMYTRPTLELDQQMLIKALTEEGELREGLLQRLGIQETSLASNPQFAAILESLGVSAPTKTSKTTGKPTLALAKNDALFQALLNGEREDVALLCEARLRVKSTTERTRAQRFLDISQRGKLPVPLSYYGALSGRWTATQKLNMHNLKRGSFLRKAIMAPEGYQLVVGDLSQIEPRVLAWLSDYQDMLDIFRAGGDPYAAFGSQMFNIHGLTKDSHPDLRQSAKSALLGCFGPDTPVLTNRGWIPVIQAQATDMVWDGEEWVCHQGLVPQGEKEVLTALGISATSEHEILTEHGWVAWSEALANRSRLASALSLASLSVSAGIARHLVDSILLCSVPVGMRPATFGSSHAAPIWQTSGESQQEKSSSYADVLQPLKQRMQTYDIAFAGPRNRYTILTDAGPLIVHNCGYGLGWASFASQLLTGFLGAPPVRYTKDFAKTLGVDQEYAQRFIDWEDNVTKMLEIPHTCTDRELLTHCLAAKKIIDIYRATAHPVVTFWDMCSNLIESSLYGGKVFQYKCLTFSKERIELPNGMSVLYPQLRREKDDKGRSQWVYGPNATKLYAGKVTNNVTQAVARIVMTDGMLRVSKKYPVVGTVHDEQIVVVPDEEVADAKTWVLEQMTLEPKYMPGIPLAADGGAHRRYGEAKT